LKSSDAASVSAATMQAMAIAPPVGSPIKATSNTLWLQWSRPVRLRAMKSQADMNAAQRRKAASLALASCVLLAAGCEGDDGETTVEPLVMTITTPTSQSAFTTTQSELYVGGRVTGLQPTDFLPFGGGGVENGATGSVSITVQGSGVWRTVSSVQLALGNNNIHAFVDVASGFAEDSLAVTRNP
jgi:hypothetical protein